MREYFFEKAYVREPPRKGPRGSWQRNVLITVDDKGYISSVKGNVSPGHQNRISGFALPGFPNSHSHAFQRVLAGRTEYKNSFKDQDNFWLWRDLMYQFANAITPDDLRNIAGFLYLEMLKAGYTSVAEFHYLHHQPGGVPYDNPAEMSLAILDAAEDVGLAVTHLPVLYMQGGFESQSLAEKQLRFGHDVESFMALRNRLKDSLGKYSSHHQLGFAFHSLRAVPKSAMTEVMDIQVTAGPIHIHIAEQMQEIEDCQNYNGQRPVEWLLSHQNVDHRWCLVHATHMTEDETAALAKSGAVVSICPTTEANLGDGFFPLKNYLNYGGRISIGSDGNSLINPCEELRWLEYGARLVAQQRNIVANRAEPHTGTALFEAIQTGGAQALGQKTGAIAVGYRADIIILDGETSLSGQVPESNILDAFIFGGGRNDIKDVMVAGEWRIKARQHEAQDKIRANYEKTLARIGV
ncbi:MAG: formimidoylglutamate deiminase [Emcibacter sp.]|nr:formimidoylglutamate deiminase [Emcibacter sp.]